MSSISRANNMSLKTVFRSKQDYVFQQVVELDRLKFWPMWSKRTWNNPN